MLAITSRRGPFRQLDAYYALQSQAEELVDNLSQRQVLCLRQLPWELSLRRFVSCTKSEGLSVHLHRSLDDLLARMAGSTCKEIKQISSANGRFEIRRNTTAVHKDFYALYHRFRLHHSSLRTLSFSRLRQFLSATADVSVAYDQEQPICGHLNLIDYQSSRVNGIWAASLRHESKNPALIASVNRWLYWNEMTVYKAAGLEAYDLGGGSPSIIQFKLRLGADKITIYDYVIACGLVRRAICLFYGSNLK